MFKFFINFFLVLLFINTANADDTQYYWKGFNIEGSSASSVAQQIQTKVNASVSYCATYELLASGDSSYEMTCYRSSGSRYNSWIISRLTCSSDSTLEFCQADYEPPVEMCEDGYPPNVYGYEDYCDRPTPKLCTDGSYVESTSFCPVTSSVCTDYDTCYNYAQSQANCFSNSSTFTFNYQSPNAFDFACETIDTSSPDHPDNGGNADGNEYNDPLSPEAPITSGNSDPSALAAAIGLELRSDFGNVERAVRDGISSAESNTDRTIEAINSAQTNLEASLSDIESAISEGNSADNGSSSVVDSVNNASSSITDSVDQSSSTILDGLSDSTNDVVGSVNGVNQSVNSGTAILSSQLSDISSKLENLESCDPNTDAQNCEGEHGITSDFITSVMDSLESLFDSENESSLETIKSEISDIESVSPLDSSVLEGVFDPILNVIPQPQECVPLTFGDTSKPYSFTLSCEFSDKFKAIFGFLLAIYTVQSLIGIIVSSARPRQEGN
ncbi:hypothetical protein EBI01_11700 [Marinomonas rhizomae]|uniref:Methyl-accepting chemotaxis protein n=1 Tax=Marinomonas rhizomae TaxID=491948 RepID=A0A366JBB9_9GAMM|nr:hypothetical protein [Marinomonas rhizomae]RBP83188.1 hypothetical protein DFP80_107166 [Marinomonas rhizomae]RNF72514.1 hypothetical protein EBI01_11700 [Marinomonas rhizomae]